MTQRLMRLMALVRTRLVPLCCFLLLGFTHAGPLKKEVSLPAYRGSLENYLVLIEDHSNVLFSYNPSYVPTDSVIDKGATTARLNDLLLELLPMGYSFSESGDYVIIKPQKRDKKDSPLANPTPKEKKYVITGRVVNSQTGEVVSEAVVYDHDRLTSTMTDQQGYYSLTVSANNDFIPLYISKNSYFDTLIIIEPYETSVEQVGLKPIEPASVQVSEIPQIQLSDSNRVQEIGVVKWVVPDKAFAKTNGQYLQKTRPAQISFLPMIGTNRQMGGLVENNFSLNILAGYSGGVKGVEVGGLVNITRFDVKGLQIAGLGNITGGTVSGVQVGGFFNNNRGNINGVQISGFYNLVMDTVEGIQVAGFVNALNGHMDGFQIAGFSNLTTKDVSGIQLAGFGNVANGDVDLLQVSGFGNIGRNVGGGQIAGFGNMAMGNVGGGQLSGFSNLAAGDVEGWQATGFMNVATGTVNGGQISGFMNIADSVGALQVTGFMNLSTGEIKGAQIAGFLNVAKKVSGLQIAAFNFADSATGIPIGLFSFVKTGFHSVGYSASESMSTIISFKTGVDRFYNIISIANSAYPDRNFSALGLGFGSMKRYNDRWSRTWEFEAFQLKSHFSNSIEYNALYELRIKAGIHLGKRIILQAGPHWAVNSRDKLINNDPELINPYGLQTYVLGDTEWTNWPGGSVNLSISF